MAHVHGLRIGLGTRAAVAGKSHRGITRAMIRTIAGDHPAVRVTTRLARKLDGVLVGIGATEREEHPSAFESGSLEQHFRQPGTRFGAPAGGHETELVGLRPYRRHHPRVLVPEIAALGEAAHVEDALAVRGVQPCAFPADDGRRVPVALAAPAVHHGVAFGEFSRFVHGIDLCGNRTIIRIANNYKFPL